MKIDEQGKVTIIYDVALEQNIKTTFFAACVIICVSWVIYSLVYGKKSKQNKEKTKAEKMYDKLMQ